MVRGKQKVKVDNINSKQGEKEDTEVYRILEAEGRKSKDMYMHLQYSQHHISCCWEDYSKKK